MRQANVYINDKKAGVIKENDDGEYIFRYDSSYLKIKGASPVSLTLPLQQEAYRSQTMFPFFDGLIPEGWLLDLAVRNWKLKANDRMGLLLASCKDCIGNVSIQEAQYE